MNLCHLNKETGKGLPDASIMVELCNILKITVNDLLCGEIVNKENYQTKFEQNIIGTLDYSNKKICGKNKIISEMLLCFGLGLIFSAFSVFPSESSWGSIYSVIGMIISLIGFIILNKGKKLKKRILLNLGCVVSIMTMLLVLDYSNVKLNNQAPRFRIATTTIGDVIYYDTSFYDVYRCNFDEENEYWTIEKNSKPTNLELINYCK